ncbi:stage III sporulation protein AF [Ornithinibacillus sp. BX22]|uniref:Stage III sporulation protein AF n=2 Tax=Ornithinibacillus TaxID=484508 RepID=A0A923RIG0_9BACI|nr:MULTISPECIES: stage III sporulation protein AF [Ornithinibacillus]MBC5637175.1 stage III sporulation protein AF [Ornithinibacillus hominis]MBS3679614.1 stage III sporulation protein AF [Ornithinibacillus massiliensis]
MDFLINWVAQIIVFILLATIIDLLVPTGGMKKYIKFVIGLVLILIFLQPIFYLFKVDIKEAVEQSFSTLINETSSDPKVENLIELQKSEIESSTSAYILEQMAVQLKDIASAPLLDNYQAEIKKLDFDFKEGAAISYEGLEEVVVYLGESEAGEGAVNAVEDVVIDARKQEVTTQEVDIDLQEVESLLRETWELSDKKLTVIWEGGTS